MDGQFHQAEQLKLREDLENAIQKARELGLSEDECKLLAWAAGVGYVGVTHPRATGLG